MTLPTPLALSGAPGSPYTRKMLAVLRYRRIPYRFLTAGAGEGEALPQPRVRLLPTFYLPDADGGLEAVTDSTPLIRRLDAAFGERRVAPEEPALAFIDALLEDYADEWLTKAMFHYRWVYPDDVARAAAVLPLWRDPLVGEEGHGALARMIAERQIGRLGVVGSNPLTGPLIEASYVRFLAAFEAHLRGSRFLLGARPGASDFGVYGQLTQLARFDPTPTALTFRLAPRAFAWVDVVEDLSGLEPADGDWTPLASAPATLRGLLAEVGRVYAPVMLANARALADGAAEVEAEVDGRSWRQAPFPYQGKCLAQLRAVHAGLPPAARAAADGLMDGTGCEALFA